MAQIHGLLDNLVRRQEGGGFVPPQVQAEPPTAGKDGPAVTTTTHRSDFPLIATTTTSAATATATAVGPAAGNPSAPPAFGSPPVLATPTNTSSVEQQTEANRGNFPVGAVVGGVVGGIALIAFVFTMLLLWRRRRQRATTTRDGGGVSSRGIGAESMEGKQPFMRASSGSGGTSDDGERGLDEFKQHPPIQYQQQQHQQHQQHPLPQRFHSESTMVDGTSPPLGPLIQSQSSLPNFGPSRPLSQTYSPSSSPSPSPIPPMCNPGAFGGQMPPAPAGYGPGQAQANASPPGPRPLYQQHSGSVPHPSNYVPRSSYIQTKALSFPNAGVSAGAVGTGAGLGVAGVGAAAMAATAGGAGVALERRNSLAPSLSEATEAGGFFELIPVDETPRIPHAELLTSSSNPIPGTTVRSGKDEDREEEEEEDRLLKDVDWNEIRRTRPASSITGLSSGVLTSPIALAGAYDDDDDDDGGEIDEGELQYL